jgi:hypothetical protein
MERLPEAVAYATPVSVTVSRHACHRRSRTCCKRLDLGAGVFAVLSRTVAARTLPTRDA